MTVKVAYAKLVVEEFEVPDSLPEFSSENYCGRICEHIDNADEIINYIAKNNPEVCNGNEWKPIGEVSSLEFSNGKDFYDLDGLRFGGEW